MVETFGFSILGFVVVIGFLIFAHESGHFLFAKLFRVRVLTFSFGFGKRLFGFRKGDTDYRVSLIPLGGYVRMAGDNPEENVAGRPDEFLSRPKWQRFIILFAGPAMNVLVAIAFMAGIAMIGYERTVTRPVVGGVVPVVGRVIPGSPAEKAGIRAGDRILSANGQPVRALADYAAVSNKVKTAPVAMLIARGTERLTVTVAPSSDEKLTLLRGVYPRTELFQLSLVPAVQYSVQENWRMLRDTFSAIGRLFRPEGSVKELSGPIDIARISAEALRSGWLPTIYLMAAISLQLGVMNLLPIPVLDGGHIMILLIEGAARRELSLRVKERIQQAGFAALATLMIVVLYNDVISNVLRIRKG